MGLDVDRTGLNDAGLPALLRALHTRRRNPSQSFAASCRSSGVFSKGDVGPCQSAPLSELRAEKGEAWTVAGVLSEPELDRAYYVVGKNVEGGIIYIVVDEGGYLKHGQNVAWRGDDGDAYESDGLPVDYVSMDVALEPAGPLVELQHDREVLEGSSPLNFDLLYAGRGAGTRTKSVRLLYKEYSPHVTDREIHSEEFVYRLYDDTISFRNFRIRVHDANDSNISYRVESDAAKDG